MTNIAFSLTQALDLLIGHDEGMMLWQHIGIFNVSPDITQELPLPANLSIPTAQNHLPKNLNYIRTLSQGC